MLILPKQKVLGAKFYAFPMSIQYSWHPSVDLSDREKKYLKLDLQLFSLILTFLSSWHLLVLPELGTSQGGGGHGREDQEHRLHCLQRKDVQAA